MPALVYDEVLAVVREWPVEQRLLLVRDILHDLADVNPYVDPGPLSKSDRPKLTDLLGMLDTGRPAPTDEEIEKMLRERREERCG